MEIKVNTFKILKKQKKNTIFRKKNILAKCPNTVWVSDGEELAEVSDIEVS